MTCMILLIWIQLETISQINPSLSAPGHLSQDNLTGKGTAIEHRNEVNVQLTAMDVDQYTI